MFLSIDRVQKFGVFGDYTKPGNISDFSEQNIIYGWNYSGKTTISRIFQSIEQRELMKGLEDGSYQLSTVSSGNITESDLITCPINVRVFNTDFIENNLSLDGSEFAPILLLGGESIEAQKEIEKNKTLIERVRVAIGKKQSKVTRLEDNLSQSRSKTAAHIKRTLAIVETYTATHLNQRLPTVRTNIDSYLLNSEKYISNLKKALADTSEKLPSKDSLVLTPSIGESIKNLPALLSEKPALTNTISSLTESGILAQWVRDGLDLHKDIETCEFCGNSLTTERREKLKSHFSKDLENHESAIKAAIKILDQAKLSHTPIHQKDFYPVSRDAAVAADKALKLAVSKYNDGLGEARTKLEEKLESPFTALELPKITQNLDAEVSVAATEMNRLIADDNVISKDFDNQKREASNLVRDHLIAEYCNIADLDSKERVIEIVKSNKEWFSVKLDKLLKDVSILEAKISDAQKGKEDLNTYISRFLSGSRVKIQVVKIDKQERFCIVRGNERARHLKIGRAHV